MLELVDHGIQADVSAGELSKKLVEAGKAFDSRLNEFRRTATATAIDVAGRELTPAEHDQLSSAQYWSDFLSIFVALSEQ